MVARGSRTVSRDFLKGVSIPVVQMQIAGADHGSSWKSNWGNRMVTKKVLNNEESSRRHSVARVVTNGILWSILSFN